MWLLLLSSILFMPAMTLEPNVFLLFKLTSNAACGNNAPVIKVWVEFTIMNSSCYTFNSSSTPNTPTMKTIPLQIAENDSVIFHWIDIEHSNFSCVTTIINATLEYRSFRELIPLCDEQGYVLSSVKTAFNDTIMFSNTSTCNDGAISVPLSCGGRVSASTTSTLTIFSSSFTMSSIISVFSSSTHSENFNSALSSRYLPSTTLFASSFILHSTLLSTTLISSTHQLSHSSITFTSSLVLPSPSPSSKCYHQIDDTDRGRFEWPLTLAGNVAIITCPNGPIGFTASRVCSSSSIWESPNVTFCATTVVANGFIKLSKVNITAENVESVSDYMSTLVENTTRTPADQNIDNSQVISNVLDKTVSLFLSQTTNLPSITETLENIIQTLDALEEWPLPAIEAVSNDIIQSFEELVRMLINEENFTSIVINGTDILFRGKRYSRNSFVGLTVSAFAFNDTLNFNTHDNSSNLTTKEVARIILPESILDIIESDDINIASTLYKKANLFPIRNDNNSSITAVGSSVDTVIGTGVISVIVGGIIDGTKLPDPVTIILAINKENATNPRCVYWNFTAAGGIGNWSTDGCNTSAAGSEYPSNVTCYCDHLTNFAVIVDISARTENGTSPPTGVRIALEVVTIVGVCLSLMGLILTILTLSVFKKLRKKDASKFHIQLCISLCCMLVVFVSGINRASIVPLCVSVGALIHYFTLVSWMWMAAEAVLMFQKIVIVFTNITWRYILIVSIVCWVVPVVPVIVLLAVDYNYYIADDNDSGFCFISELIPFLASFLVPIFLIIIFNLVIFALIIRVTIRNAIKRKKRLYDSAHFSVSEVLKLLLSFTGIMILFGLAWLFAVFTFISEPAVSYTIQFIFSFFTIFQGFYIFVFFVLLNSEYRKPWEAIFCPESRNKNTLTTSKAYKYNIYDTNTFSKEDNKKNEVHLVPLDKNTKDTTM